MVEMKVAKNLLQNKTRWVITNYLKSFRDNEKWAFINFSNFSNDKDWSSYKPW